MTDLGYIKKFIRSGDLLLFCGNSDTSRKIMLASSVFQPTTARFSHVENCVWRDGDLYSFGAVEPVAALMNFDDRVRSYEGSVSLRCVVDFHAHDRDAIAIAHVDKFCGVPYERNRRELAGAALDLFRRGVEDLTSIFCTESYSELCQSMMWLPDDIPSNSYAPADFQDDRGLRLIGAHFTPEIVLKQ